jgi:hypothetical protein
MQPISRRPHPPSGRLAGVISGQNDFRYSTGQMNDIIVLVQKE